MGAPKLPVQLPLPAAGEQPMTYPELMDKLKCVCSGGAQIVPGPLPSATINMGDIIADHAKYLSIFTSIYGMITTILKMIACIIDVLCALTNPIALIKAMVKLFSECLPAFILLFPQFAVPAIIICILKIVLAIIQYIITVILPVILDIIRNVQNLIDAFSSGNTDAQNAIAFKIVALIKELFNIVGIMAVLGALFIMIKALLQLGISIPCGGSDSCCNEEVCPSFIHDNTVVNGHDGELQIIYEGNIYTYRLRFGSASNRNNFLSIKDFFPAIDYTQIDSVEKAPYTLTDIEDYTANTEFAPSAATPTGGIAYAATSVDSEGFLNVIELPGQMNNDGYLSSVSGTATLTIPFVRFGTHTLTFNSNSLFKLLEIQDKRTTAAGNGGTYVITEVYDGYNVKIARSTSGGFWDGDNSEPNPDPFISWRLKSIPTAHTGRTFTFDINHNELVRYNTIGVGCHPAVSAARAGALKLHPDPGPLPSLDGYEAIINDLNKCIEAIAPKTVDAQYVLDNYAMIAVNAGHATTCLSDRLAEFQFTMTDYVKNIYGRTFDPVKSANYFFANPLIQLVGENIQLTFSPYDIYGALMGTALPLGIISVKFNSTAGAVGSVTEVMDGYGNSTGLFHADLTSPTETLADVTVQVDDQYASTWDGANLTPKAIQVQFVMPAVIGQREEASTEPLGKNTGE